METLGVYEAKQRLPELLRRAAAGESFTLTRHGKSVALLIPCDVLGTTFLKEETDVRTDHHT